MDLDMQDIYGGWGVRMLVMDKGERQQGGGVAGRRAHWTTMGLTHIKRGRRKDWTRRAS